MRLISISEYQQKTMQLAKPVLDKHRRILLAAGRTIHPIYLQKLEEMDIRYLFVEDRQSFGITLEEMLDMPTWMDGVEQIQLIYEAIKNKKEISVRELQKFVLRLLNELSKRKVLVLIPSTSLAIELREFAHCVNVALLALQLAKKRTFTQTQLRDLTLGCLLHDIGKAVTDDTFSHPVEGFELLRKVREISLLSAHVAFQHHEAADGSGFPRGVKKEQIHEFAQICAIANTYESLLSKEGMPPHEALEFIMTKSGNLFSEELVQQFIQEIPPYIPGTKVRLNTGELAIITKIVGNIQRPFVRLIESGREFSLADNYTILIKEVVINEP